MALFTRNRVARSTWIAAFIAQVIVTTGFVDAQVRARVQGPQQAQVGDLVVIDGSQSEATEFRWLLTNSSKQFLTVDDGKRVVFATGSSGSYRFLLVVGGATEDGKLDVDFAEWTVTVSESTPSPDEPIDPDRPDPIEPEQPDFQALTRLITRLSESVTSPSRRDEAQLLATSFRTFGLQAEQYESIAAFTQATSDDYKSKLGVAAYLPWSQSVFAPLAEELRQLRDSNQLNDLKDFGAAWQAIAVGFEGVK